MIQYQDRDKIKEIDDSLAWPEDDDSVGFSPVDEGQADAMMHMIQGDG